MGMCQGLGCDTGDSEFRASQEDVDKLRKGFYNQGLVNDGRIDRNGTQQFLKVKGMDPQYASALVDDLFGKCKIDIAGQVDLEEFIGNYVQTKETNLLREFEIRANINMHQA